MADEENMDPARKKVTIEQAAEKLGIPAWQAAGLKARHGWPIGKLITPGEYKTALDAWLNGPTVEVKKDGDA